MESPKFWFKPGQNQPSEASARLSGDDSKKTPVYVYTDEIEKAVNVAGATGRPLLVDGPSGCGKSSLARHIAHVMNWDLEFFPVTSRTQASDLLYSMDLVKRLRDEKVGEWNDYLTPGVLWKAFDPEGAQARSSSTKPGTSDESFKLPTRGKANGCVVLIDEIDKADPDVPNNLLVPLGSFFFEVPELNARVERQRHTMIVMTTNNERRLPDAFLRRCIQVTVPALPVDKLKEVARAHYPSTDELKDTTIAAILARLAPGDRLSEGVSTAEFLDAIAACVSLNVDPESADWDWINRLAATKLNRRQGSL